MPFYPGHPKYGGMRKGFKFKKTIHLRRRSNAKKWGDLCERAKQYEIMDAGKWVREAVVNGVSERVRHRAWCWLGLHEVSVRDSDGVEWTEANWHARFEAAKSAWLEKNPAGCGRSGLRCWRLGWRLGG
jgi:hypothetical protein